MWQCGNVAMWQCGNVAMWQCGNVKIEKIFLLNHFVLKLGHN